MKLGAKNTKSKRDAIGKLRKTQLITTFATGAIADMPDYTVIMAATDYWNHYSPVIHEPNLERLLGVSKFKEPYATDSDNPKGNPDIPAFRFPRYHFCPSCGSLKDYKLFGDPKFKKCTCSKGKALVPSRFVCSCINGHLEDFPYKWWVHYGNTSECPSEDKWDQIEIQFKNTTGGLSSINIKCKSCGKERTMEYEALCAGYTQDEDESEPEQFIAEETEIPDILDGYVESVMLVKRLREVMAIKGFRRITPEKPQADDERARGMNGNEYQPVWNKAQDWLPAIEMRGEGIFIKFDEEKLAEWEENNADRYIEMAKRRILFVDAHMQLV